MTNITPLVSVVTVNFNMREGLGKTISSVAAQTYPRLEYIVIDGASTDGSIDVIRKNLDHIAHWVSERDRNLYDGMNKGIAAATGEWILFMNSGDCFADARVVANMFSQSHDDADLVYGHAVWRYERENIERLVVAKSPSILPHRMHCSHQAIFTRTSLLRDCPFDLALLIADYNFLLECWINGARFKPIDLVVAMITKGGRSDQLRLTVLRQQQRVLAKHKLLTSSMRLQYPVAVIMACLGFFLRSILPRCWVRWLFARQAA